MNNGEIVADFFDKTCANAKEGWQASMWLSEDDQYERFAVAIGILPNLSGEYSVLDVGCGTGDLYPFLKTRNKGISYTGVDISTAMIEKAKQKWPKANFVYNDFMSPNFPEINCQYDYVFGIGSFNLKVNEQDQYIEETLEKMWRLARRGMVVTMLSDNCDGPKHEQYYYYDASKILQWCLKKTKYLMVNHASTHPEFVVFMYKDE